MTVAVLSALSCNKSLLLVFDSRAGENHLVLTASVSSVLRNFAIVLDAERIAHLPSGCTHFGMAMLLQR